MLTLNEEQHQALERAVARGDASSLAEALNSAILAFCAQSGESIEADPAVLELLKRRGSEMQEGKAHDFESVEEMDAFLRSLITEQIAGKVEA